MSVINRMLQELEERHDDAVQTRMPDLVRAVPVHLPPYKRHRVVWAILLTLLVGVISYLGLYGWTQIAEPLLSSPASASSPPLSASAVAPAPSNRIAQETALVPSVPPAVESVSPAPAPHANPAMPNPPAPAPGSAAQPMFPVSTPRKHIDAAQASVTSKPMSAAPKPHVDVSPNPDTVAPAGAIAAPKPVPALNSAPIKQESNAQRADFRYREALSLIAQGRLQEAQPALEEALKLEPKHAAARQVLLGLWVDAKRYAQAEQLLQDGLNLGLPSAPLASALARVQLERGDQSLALATLDKYAKAAGNHAEYLGFHAALLQRANRHADALKQFHAALRHQPDNAHWLMGAGISLQAEKRYSDADQAYRHALATQALPPELRAFVEQRLRQVQQAQ